MQSFGLEYERYLKEVVGVLESDEVFRKKLQESNVSEIKVKPVGVCGCVNVGMYGCVYRYVCVGVYV